MVIINSPDTPSVGNGPVQRVKLGESTRHKWVKTKEAKSKDYMSPVTTTAADAIPLCSFFFKANEA